MLLEHAISSCGPGNTTRQALWLPTSREAKYRAKQAVDSFFVRMGDVVQAGLVHQVAAGATTSLRTVDSGIRTNSFVP